MCEFQQIITIKCVIYKYKYMYVYVYMYVHIILIFLTYKRMKIIKIIISRNYIFSYGILLTESIF